MGLEFTKTELEDAIREIFQKEDISNAILSSCPLPVGTRMAGEKAFLDELTGPSVEIVREALKMLSNPGFFEFVGDSPVRRPEDPGASRRETS